MTDCPAPGSLVEREIDRVLTHYRESPKLLHLIRTYLGQAEQVIGAICDLPSAFDIDSAGGDQLTLVGKRLGWPRCHCVCNVQPVFGFACDGVPTDDVITGFCDDNNTWADCGPFGTSDICINDDEVYRSFLKARRYQMLALFDLASLTAAIQHLLGPTATVLDAGVGRVVLAPGRELTAAENALLQLYPRVLPVAPGIRIRFHFGPLEVFGFGEGWGGFCDEWEPDGLPLVTASGELILVSGASPGDPDRPLMTGPLTRDAEWMCEIDTRPYDCAA